ncbi:hypothetical protein CP8484711_1627B, partial [Chlamydia psittaci 84-8471/1]
PEIANILPSKSSSTLSSACLSC